MAGTAIFFEEDIAMKESFDKERLDMIVDFCKEIDKEKFIQRRTYLTGGERFENDAEHAWHMAIMALLLEDYSNEKVDIHRVVSILLIHDLVEVYAGDTFAYDEVGKLTQRQRELDAADKLFAILPEDLGRRFKSLWDEFEAWETPEARFAHTLDNFQPLMQQDLSKGKSWKECNRKLSEVLRRNERSAQGSEVLWDYARKTFIDPQIEKGNLIED